MSVIQVTVAFCVLYQVLGQHIPKQYYVTPENTISQLTNRFTMDMYNVMKGTSGNILVSPFSMNVLLTLLYLGSRGKVKNEVQAALHITPSNEYFVKEGFKELIAKLDNSEPLEIATKMFPAVNFRIKNKFLDDAQTYFNTVIDSLDYLNNPEKSVQSVNSFVAQKTHNKIPNLITGVPPDTALLLLNALYFKADWKHKFPKNRRDKFFTTKTNSTEVELMTQTEDFNYKFDRDLSAHILELPYKDDEYSMFIILPEKVDGLPAVEDKIATMAFELIIDGMRKSEIAVQLPKFRMEQAFLLNDILMKLGMPTMFVPSQADLSGIADGPLYVSYAFQKTFINVNENGTEAVAGSGVYFQLLSASSTTYFTANHPFLFAIAKKPENTVLFIGRYAIPEQ